MKCSANRGAELLPAKAGGPGLPLAAHMDAQHKTVCCPFLNPKLGGLSFEPLRLTTPLMKIELYLRNRGPQVLELTGA